LLGGTVYPTTLLSVLIKSNSKYWGYPSQSTFKLGNAGGKLPLGKVDIVLAIALV